MTSRIAAFLTLVVVAATAPAAPDTPNQANHTKPYAVQVNTADAAGWTVTRGATDRLVLKRFGPPDQKLSPDLWLYHHFSAIQDRPETHGCTVLALTFKAGVVVDIALINPPAIAALSHGAVMKQPEVVADVDTKSPPPAVP